MNRFVTSVAALAAMGISTVAAACPMHGGKIADINRDTNRVVVVKGDDVASFRAEPSKVQITLDGKKATLADLKPGDKINVNYDMNDEMTKIQAKRSES